MPRLIWSPPALADVQRLYRFLALKDEGVARRAIKTIRTSVKILAHQPEAGRPVEDMEPVFREWLIDFGNSGYIALYRFARLRGQVLLFASKAQKQHVQRRGDFILVLSKITNARTQFAIG